MGGPLGASIRLLRPSCGLPDPTTPPVKHRVNQCAPISEALSNAGVSALSCSPEQLAKVVFELRAFMDRRFGRLSDVEGRSMTMLPAFVFRDFAPGGPLFVLLKALFEYAAGRQQEVSFEDEEFGEALLAEAERVLRSQGWLTTKKVFISPLVDEEEEEKLRDILQRHAAVMVSNSLVATHILYPDPEGMRENQTDGQALVRVLDHANFGDQDYKFVHWFYHPDSYDDWVPSSEVLGHVYLPRERKDKEQWHVQARWARDLELNNEWMNELDYEMPEAFNDYVGRSPRPPKLDPNGRPYNPLIRLRLRLPTPQQSLKDAKLDSDLTDRTRSELDLESRANTAVNPHRVANGSQFIFDAADVSTGKLPNGHKEAHDLGGQFMLQRPNNGHQEPISAASNEPTKIQISEGVYIPFFAKWFSLDSIHAIERRALPDFFQNRFPSKTEESYREIRNFMVQRWRENPRSHLSGTAARRHLGGDACSVLRVHTFLEHWGLINYGGVESSVPPSFAPPPRPLPLHAGHDRDDSVRLYPQLISDSGGRVQVKDGRVIKFGRDEEILGDVRTESILIRDTDQNGNVTSIAETPQREPIEYHCDSCGVDCSVLRFHCATKADVDLCSSCYQNEKYSATMKPRDFIQMNSAGGSEDIDSDVWTESETLLLLEALEMYGDNWTLVSEHVGSKGKSQCVVQFLRLPIEDTFLRTVTKDWWFVGSGDAEEIAPVDIMRRAAAREAALAAVSANTSGGKAFSGQPVVCADQISTVAAFASNLASQTPPELLKELTRVMGLGGNTRKRRRSYWMDEAGCRGGMAEAGDEELLTGKLYERARKRLRTPVQVLESENGVGLARGVLSLITTGAISEEEAKEMVVEGIPGALRDGVGADGEMNGKLNGTPVEALETGQAERGKMDRAELDREMCGDKMQEGDVERSTAICVTSLVAACHAASERHALEEAELSRLYDLIKRIREALISKRRAHRDMIGEYERFENAYRKKKACEEMAERINRQLTRLRKKREEGGGEEDLTEVEENRRENSMQSGERRGESVAGNREPGVSRQIEGDKEKGERADEGTTDKGEETRATPRQGERQEYPQANLPSINGGDVVMTTS
eukprot:GFKZ01010741.1.p1 GENE.GFKZ01010741.1~~GFKZ01010741.1.p1  ORF type:complete len:1106 (+),score=198.97 GFKZ01010741.1:192-3509(+)